jgi:cellulose synthase/poly-beta-1,6-N-acetylglucosamine synthase-like glycosyltransferase
VIIVSLLLGFLIFKQINFFSTHISKTNAENSISAEYLKGMIAKGDLDYKNSKESFESFFELEKNQANLSKVPLVVQYNLMKLSIIIPVYNEEKTINEIVDRVKKVDLSMLGLKKEIIVVDDGSKDKTPNIIMYKNGVNMNIMEDYIGLINRAVNESLINTNYFITNFKE